MADLPKLSLDDNKFLGDGLKRPECVLAVKTGEVFASDARGGVSATYPDGRSDFIAARGAPADLMPNGIALTPERNFLLANLAESSGVWRMSLNGEAQPVLMEADGVPLPPVNFVGLDRKGRMWVSVSSTQIPRDRAFKQGTADGLIVLMDDRGARIVCDDIAFANEAIVDPSGQWLYVNETMGRKTIRFPIRENGDLGPRETFADYPPGTLPDGFNFDSEGGVWMVSVGSNRIIRTGPDGRQDIQIEDAEAEDVAEIAAAAAEDRFERRHIEFGAKGALGNIASLAFGGPDLNTVYMGALANDRIATFRSPIAGAPPVHWDY